jgi:tRNA(Arg) A34 adenosine deaminase TadA
MAASPASPGLTDIEKVVTLWATAYLIDHQWNCLKPGTDGRLYDDRNQHLRKEDVSESLLKGSYLGHNIAAIAVYLPTKTPIMFAFNHVSLFRSHAQTHAEHRLIKWCFENPLVYHNQVPPVQPYNSAELGRTLAIVSSLEPCWLCAGALKMCDIREVVYMESDPGVGNSMQTVANGFLNGLQGPSETAGISLKATIELLGLSNVPAQLEWAYMRFNMHPPVQMWRTEPHGPLKNSDGIPAFLCSSEAKRLFQRCREEWEPLGRRLQGQTEHALWERLNTFLARAVKYQRGTMTSS